jgi:light-regulated signal transduction histidine kinase (bacteriophytochrome)
MINGERLSVGVLEIKTERPLIESEIISLELVLNYLASVAYHSVVRVASGYMALEELEEEAERMRYEENRLHVQNMVMDNCLSVIKHETVYYPNRIKELAEQTLKTATDIKATVADMGELMEYYSSVFGILSNCARRELDETSFKLTKIELSRLFDNAKQKAERIIKKTGLCIDVVCEETDAVVFADTDLVDFIFEQLFAVALNIKKEGKLLLRAIDSGEFVTVELYDNRYEMSNDEVAEVFVPTKRNVENGNKGVNAMEYLVAKEIIRLHEDYIGKHGGRMEARSDVSGTVVLFTLPK